MEADDEDVGRVSAGESLGGPEKITSPSEPEFPQRTTEVPDAPGGGLRGSPEIIHWKGENQAWAMTGLKQLAALPVTLRLGRSGARTPQQGGQAHLGEKGVAKFREKVMGFKVH